jgi:hypothetical protein
MMRLLVGRAVVERGIAQDAHPGDDRLQAEEEFECSAAQRRSNESVRPN